MVFIVSDILVAIESASTPDSRLIVSDTISVVTDDYTALDKQFRFSDFVSFTEDYNVSLVVTPTFPIDTLFANDYFLHYVVVETLADVVYPVEVFSGWIYGGYYTDYPEFIEVFDGQTVLPAISDIETLVEEYNFTSTPGTLTISDMVSIIEIYHLIAADGICEEIVPVLGKVRFVFGGVNFDIKRYEFGNTRAFTYARINRQSQAGSTIIGSTRFIIKDLDLEFTTTNKAEVEALFEQLCDYTGQVVQFRDHEGNWLNVIPTGKPEIAEVRRGLFTITNATFEVI